MKLPYLAKPHDYTVLAADFIPANELIGSTHIQDPDIGLVELVLGAFLTHSQAPNCMLNTRRRIWSLWCTEDIYENEVLTINKILYGLEPV